MSDRWFNLFAGTLAFLLTAAWTYFILHALLEVDRDVTIAAAWVCGFIAQLGVVREGGSGA